MAIAVQNSGIRITDRDLIYTRKFYEVEMDVNGMKFCMWVEEEAGKVIRHWCEGNKNIAVWNSLTVEQMDVIESVLKDDFEL